VPVKNDGEPLPASEAQPTQYFSESSHCTKIVGDSVLGRLLVSAIATPDFSVSLAPAMFEAHLSQLTAERDQYRRAKSDQIAFFHRVAARSRAD